MEPVERITVNGAEMQWCGPELCEREGAVLARWLDDGQHKTKNVVCGTQ